MRFLALEIATTTSGWICWQKCKNQIFTFFEIFEMWVQHFFKIMGHMNLKNHFFFIYQNYNVWAFIRIFKCSKILKNKTFSAEWKFNIMSKFEKTNFQNLKNLKKIKFSNVVRKKNIDCMKKIPRTKKFLNCPKNLFVGGRSC